MQTDPTLSALRDLERHLRMYDAKGYKAFIRTTPREIPALLRQLTGRDDLPEAPLLDCVNGALAVLRQELGGAHG